MEIPVATRTKAKRMKEEMYSSSNATRIVVGLNSDMTDTSLISLSRGSAD
jgi:hypothetical protein